MSMSILLCAFLDIIAIPAKIIANIHQYNKTSIPYGLSSPPVIDQTKPQKNGAGRYPSKLLTTWDKLFALYRCFGSTDEIITPVIVGITPAPKKSKPHINMIKGQKDRTNGIGSAHSIAIIPITSHRLSAFLFSYPPTLCVSIPPPRTPSVGAVIVQMTYPGKTIVLSFIIIVSMQSLTQN